MRDRYIFFFLFKPWFIIEISLNSAFAFPRSVLWQMRVDAHKRTGQPLLSGRIRKLLKQTLWKLQPLPLEDGFRHPEVAAPFPQRMNCVLSHAAAAAPSPRKHWLRHPDTIPSVSQNAEDSVFQQRWASQPDREPEWHIPWPSGTRGDAPAPYFLTMPHPGRRAEARPFPISSEHLIMHYNL